MTGDPLVPVAVLAVRRRPSEPVAPPQVDELQDQENPHDQIKHLRVPVDHQTLPGPLPGSAMNRRSEYGSSRPPASTGQRKAGATGLEPATSGVTGRRSNQLSYSRFGGREPLGCELPCVKHEACVVSFAKLVGGDGFEPPTLSV